MRGAATYCVASFDVRFGMATSSGKRSRFSTSSCRRWCAKWAPITRSWSSGEARAIQVLAQEENRFAETLATGMALLDAEAAKLELP